MVSMSPHHPRNFLTSLLSLSCLQYPNMAHTSVPPKLHFCLHRLCQRLSSDLAFLGMSFFSSRMCQHNVTHRHQCLPASSSFTPHQPRRHPCLLRITVAPTPSLSRSPFFINLYFILSQLMFFFLRHPFPLFFHHRVISFEVFGWRSK
jgi:hypothetical protein